MTTILNLSIDLILKSYLECALWASELDECGIDEIAKISVNKSTEDIQKFLDLVSKDNDAMNELFGCDENYIGHNLWLSRNGHGAGFFDENKNKLQNYANTLKEINAWVGGKTVYFE